MSEYKVNFLGSMFEVYMRSMHLCSCAQFEPTDYDSSDISCSSLFSYSMYGADIMIAGPTSVGAGSDGDIVGEGWDVGSSCAVV